MIKILIVDDSVFSQNITGNLIKKYLPDTQIFFGKDGQEGFEKYKEINPDYILLDLLMPEVNGGQLIKLIKEQDGNAKIFVVSADVQKNVREEIESLDVISFINKPFNEEKAKYICDYMRNDGHENR